MFGFFKRGSGPDFWLEDSSMSIHTFVKRQLDELGRSTSKSWGDDLPLVLGYVAGAAEHLCASQSKKGRAADLTTLLVADMTGAPFEVARDALLKLQSPLDPNYLVAHRLGWADWTVKDDANGLVGILKVMSTLAEARNSSGSNI